MFVHCGDLEIIDVTYDLFCPPMLERKVKTNLDWERLNLKPITLDKLKPMLRSGPVRVAVTTEPGLRFMTITRHPKLAGRKAKRIKRGWWETYEAGVGWVSISNNCHIWLHP